MERWVGKVAIVTGASSGIGAASAEALVRAGVNVVGLARRIEKIQELASKLEGEKGKLHPVKCDLRKEEDILNAFQWAERKLGGVDILLNNAGLISVIPLIEGTTETFRNILDVNVLAVAIAVREAVKSMKKRNVAGHLIMINSIAGHNAEGMGPGLYTSSKFAITGMVATLHNEIDAAKLNIKVTSISPGLVATEMPANAGLPKEILDSPMSLAAKDIADAVLYALATPPNVQVKELTITAQKKLTLF